MHMDHKMDYDTTYGVNRANVFWVSFEECVSDCIESPVDI